MSLRAAAQQALEALEQFAETKLVRTSGVITALRTALAEPEQEPVAWRYELATAIFESGEYSGWRCTISEKEPCVPENSIRNLQPLYTHPPQRKPLTDEEIVDLWADVSIDYDDQINIIEMARAIERAHGIGGEA